MNDPAQQTQMMNQAQAQMMGLSQPPPQMMMSQMVAQSSQPQIMSQSQAQQQQMMLNRPYKGWSQQLQLQLPPLDPSKKFQKSNFGPGRNNWKGKKGTDNRKDQRRVDKPMLNASMSGPTSSGGYKPPTLQELQSQNRMKARKFYPKKNRFNNNNRFAPYAPRNTTSFIIRAKKAGGIASLVSPCPVTPAVLPTPIFSPSREVLGDTAKEEWGVDGYGSMKGLIRLRSPGNEDEEEEEGEGGGGSSESDVEEHVEVERRLDHDLSRFEMIYPNYSGVEYNNVLENRVDDQDTHIAQLEEENLTLKERLFLMEGELGDLRRRLQFLERQHHVVEEVVENGSENESEGGSADAPPPVCVDGKNNDDVFEYMAGNRATPNLDAGAKLNVVPPMCLDGKNSDDVFEIMSGNRGSQNLDAGVKQVHSDGTSENEHVVRDVCMEELVPHFQQAMDEFVSNEQVEKLEDRAREVVPEKNEEAKTNFTVDEASSEKDGYNKEVEMQQNNRFLEEQVNAEKIAQTRRIASSNNSEKSNYGGDKFVPY